MSQQGRAQTLKHCFAEMQTNQSTHTRPQNCHGPPRNCEQPPRNYNGTNRLMNMAWWPSFFKGQHNGLLFAAFNAVLEIGVVPESWKKIIFTMLPKFKRALQPADFRPIVSLRLLYKTLVILSFDGLKNKLTKHNLRNNTVSVQSTALKNIG